MSAGPRRLTFGLLASEAAGVVLLLALGAGRAGGLQGGRVLEPLSPRHLLVHVVGQVPHDAHTVLHRLSVPRMLGRETQVQGETQSEKNRRD